MHNVQINRNIVFPYAMAIENSWRRCHDGLLQHLVCAIGCRSFRFVPAASEYSDGNGDARDKCDWVHPLEDLRKHDIRDVLERLSALVDKHGGVSLPAFHGCMRVLLEVRHSCRSGWLVQVIAKKMQVTRFKRSCDAVTIGRSGCKGMV